MPQASQQLRDQFDSDSAAWAVLSADFIDHRGTIYPKFKNFAASDIQYAAIDYLVSEWDYGYISKPRI